MVEDGDTTVQAAQLAGAVHPGGALPVGLPFVLFALRIGEGSSGADRQSFRDAYVGQPRFVGRKERDRGSARGAQGEFQIEASAFRRIVIERKGTRIVQGNGTVGRDPFGGSGKAADLTAGDALELSVDNFAAVVALQPEVVVIDSTVAYPDAMMVAMIGRRLGQQREPVGGAQRIQVGFPARRAVLIPRVLLPPDPYHQQSILFKDFNHRLQNLLTSLSLYPKFAGNGCPTPGIGRGNRLMRKVRRWAVGIVVAFACLLAAAFAIFHPHEKLLLERANPIRSTASWDSQAGYQWVSNHEMLFMRSESQPSQWANYIVRTNFRYYTYDTAHRTERYLSALSERQRRLQTDDFGGYWAKLSRDGHWLLWSSFASRRGDLPAFNYYAASLDGSNLLRWQEKPIQFFFPYSMNWLDDDHHWISAGLNINKNFSHTLKDMEVAELSTEKPEAQIHRTSPSLDRILAGTAFAECKFSGQDGYFWLCTYGDPEPANVGDIYRFGIGQALSLQSHAQVHFPKNEEILSAAF